MEQGSGTDRRFAGSVVVVTGAGSGIGASTARLLAAEGATVYCADIDEAGCERTSDEIRVANGRAFAVPLDVTLEAQWETALRRVIDGSSRLNVLVNSAGISFGAPISDMTLEQWRRVL